MKYSIICLGFIQFFALTFAQNEEFVEVATPRGTIRGQVHWTRPDGARFLAFRGIRYATAERFELAQPFYWENVLEAIEDGFVCPQPSTTYVMDEDCLHLSVYVREDVFKSGQKVPVLIFLRGGGFATGSNMMELDTGPHYLLDHEESVVFVAINSRLNVFGYFGVGGPDFPDNLGLKDQVLGIKWVKENIGAFGGSDTITLIGGSTGATTVALHMSSPMSQGLFQRGIMFSGGTIGGHVEQLNFVEENIYAVSQKANCPIGLSFKYCLKNLSWQDLVVVGQGLIWRPVNEYDFGQERFLVEDPQRILPHVKFDVMSMVAQEEAAFTKQQYRDNPEFIKDFNENFDEMAPLTFGYSHIKNETRLKQINDRLRDATFGDGPIDAEGLSSLYGEHMFEFNVHRTEQLLQKGESRVFVFQFSYEGQYCLNPYQGSCGYGIGHGDELLYYLVHKKRIEPIVPGHPDWPFVHDFTLRIVNFARNGDPNANGLVPWSPSTADNSVFLNMKGPGKDTLEIGFPKADRYKVWDELFPFEDLKEVTTPRGIIRGKVHMTRPDGARFLAFRGIRYATAERFELAKPYYWEEGEVFEALEDGLVCPQSSEVYVMGEDCLHLSVYVREDVFKSGQKVPVIVFLRGGGFSTGSNMMEFDTGPHYLLDHEESVVFVAINSRLNVFGYMSTGTEELPGNLGLKDQVLGIKWVKENIGAFGGSDKITFMGGSSGGSTVALHMASPMSKGLFQRGIMFSGAISASHIEQKNHLNSNARTIAERLSCENDIHLKDCLKKFTWQEVSAAAQGLQWQPVIENDFGQERFLVEDPQKALAHVKYDVMSSVTRDETVNIKMALTDNPIAVALFDQAFDMAAPIAFGYSHLTDENRKKNITARLREATFGDGPADAIGLAALHEESAYTFSIHRTEQLLMKGNSRVFVFQFAYEGEFCLEPYQGSCEYGIGHGNELLYYLVHKKRIEPIEPSHPDWQFVHDFTLRIVNFARNGNPNADGLVNWSPSLIDNQVYLDMKGPGKDTLEIGFPKADRYQIWDELFPFEDDFVDIEAPRGAIRGKVHMTRPGGARFLAFRGIRYATAERFELAEPYYWEEGEVLEALEDGLVCPQSSQVYVMGEDCLHLSVYVREDVFKSGQKVPVIVFLRGGGFSTGSNMMEFDTGPHYLLDHEESVVFVAINSRLNVFGYMSTGTEELPGNLGLKDQVLGIKWVKENIGAFSGSDKITFMGGSSGGSTVALHMASPMSKGFFQRGIMFSGGLFASHVEQRRDWHPNAFFISQKLNCPLDDDFKNCLKKFTWQEISAAAVNLRWGPVIENDFGQERFLVEDPQNALAHVKYDVMSSVTKDEGILNRRKWEDDPTFVETMRNDWDTWAPQTFGYSHITDRKRRQNINDRLRVETFGDRAIDAEGLSYLDEEATFTFNVHRTEQLLQKGESRVFVFQFSYEGQYCLEPYQGTCVGVGHGNELLYYLVHKKRIEPIVPGNPDWPFVHDFTLRIVNFARNGEPNGLGLEYWPPTHVQNVYLDMKGPGKDSLEIGFPKADRYYLWDELFPFEGDNDDDEKSLMWLWITLGVVGGVLVLGGIIFTIIRMKKKNKSKFTV